MGKVFSSVTINEFGSQNFGAKAVQAIRLEGRERYKPTSTGGLVNKTQDERRTTDLGGQGTGTNDGIVGGSGAGDDDDVN